MCHPVVIPIVAMVVSAAGTYAGMKQQQQLAQQQQEQQQSALDAQRKVAISTAQQNAQLQNDAAARQAETAKEQAALDSLANQKKGAEAVGRAITGAAAGGVMGLSVDQSIIGLYSDTDAAQSNIERNLETNLSNIQTGQISSELQRDRAITSPVTTVGVQQPNTGAALLGFGETAAKQGGKLYEIGEKRGWWGQ